MARSLATSLATPPQQDRSRKSLERILAAAETVLLRGIDGFTIANVAVEGGLTVGGIYARFKSKDELLQALKDRVIHELEMNIDRYFRSRDFVTVEECLGAFAKILQKHVDTDELLQRHLLAAADSNSLLSDRGDAGRAHIRNIYCAAIARIEPYGSPNLQPYISLSFELIVTPWLERIKKGWFHAELTWPDFMEHLQLAAAAYLKALSASPDAAGQ